jgi:hypothetical protein
VHSIKSRLPRIVWVLIRRLAHRQGLLAVQLVRIRVASEYVKGVKTIRALLLFYLGLLALIGLIMAGVVVFHIGLFYVLPGSLKVRAALLMMLGVFYFSIPLIVLFFWSRDQFWMKASGADEIVKNALKGTAPRKEK